MTMEVVSIIAVGVALAGTNLYLARGQNELRRDVNGRIDALARDIADLRERMVRLEGLMVGFIRREGADARSR